MIYRQNKSGHWMAKWKFRGQVIRRSTRETNKNAARKAESRMRSEFTQEQEQIEKAATIFDCDTRLLAYCPECNRIFRSDRAMIAVDETRLCQQVCRDRWNKRCVPLLANFLKNDFLPAFAGAKRKSRIYYEYGVARLLGSDFARFRLDEISSQHAMQFVASHLPKLSPSTINCALRTLRHALNLAEEWGKLDRAPKIPLAQGERKRDRVVSEAEFAAYIELCEQPWRDIALLIRYEGIRPGEAYPLRWEHVLLEERLILIIGGKTPAARRRLPMTPEVHAALRRRHRDHGEPETGWIFPAGSASGHIEQGSAKNHHQKVTRILGTISAAHEQWKRKGSKGDWMKQAAKNAGVECSFIEQNFQAVKNGFQRFEPYCLRHTALTRLAEAGCDAFTLAKIAGHSSISVTQRYCHPQAEAIELAFAKLPVIVEHSGGGTCGGH